MNKKKLIIFDLDGTLINTLKDLNNSVNHALDKFNYPHRTVEQTRQDIGNGVAKLIARSIPDNENNPHYQECLSIFKAHYREHYFDFSRPYPEVKETLLELKKRGYKLAVVSNKIHEGAYKLVTHYFENIFDAIQGHEEPYHTKPYPDMVNAVLLKLGISGGQALYVGDTEVDYNTAKNAQIAVILVNYGYRSEEFLKDKIKGVTTIDTPKKLIDLLG